jgi:hypothetical protein
MKREKRKAARAKAVLDEYMPPQSYFEGLDYSWRVTRGGDEKLTLDAFTSYGAVTLTLHEPEKVVVEFIEAAAVSFGSLRKGDGSLRDEGNFAVMTLHIFAGTLGPKVGEALQEAAEEAEAMSFYGILTPLRDSFAKVDDRGELQAENWPEIRTRLLEMSARRKTTRLEKIARQIPPEQTKGEVLLRRAVKTCNLSEDRRKLTLEELARLVTERYAYDPQVTGEALRKLLVRYGVKWAELKSGQIQSSGLSVFRKKNPVE